MFNRYLAGMQFGTHVDGAVRMIPETGGRLRTDLSATLFLVPPESYEGGELIIESDFGSERVKYAAGDLMVYTSTSRHRVSAVTAGVRIASVFWIQSLIRDDVEARAAVRTRSDDPTSDTGRHGSGVVGTARGALSQPTASLDGHMMILRLDHAGWATRAHRAK